jgi:hypothetical protein
MSRFLKLSNRIVNTALIQHVYFDKTAGKYSIHLAGSSTQGLFILGSGNISSYGNEIYATKEEHPASYEAIERWYNSVECVSNKNNKD